MKSTVTKYLLIFLALVFILVVTISYLLYLRKSTPQANPAVTPMATSPAESQVGTIIDIVTQPDETITLTIDSQPAGQKTYQLPKDQQIILYTSSTETITIPLGQADKGTTVNMKKSTNTEQYKIIGVTDKELIENLFLLI